MYKSYKSSNVKDIPMVLIEPYNDEPSTSNAQPSISNENTINYTFPIKHQTKEEKLRKNAKEQFFEGISICGLLEFYYAPTRPIRLLWMFALIASIGSIIYHSTLLIQFYLNQPPSYEVMQTDLELIPFPKVTVCAPSGINKTWAARQIRIPPKEKRELFDKLTEQEKEELKEEVTGLLGNYQRFIIETGFNLQNPRYFAYHHILMQSFPDFRALQPPPWKPGQMTSCTDTISSCQFNGRNIDCCFNSTVQIDDDGPCYDIGVDKLEIDNTRRTIESPITLTIELKMYWNDILPYSTTNGFSIHIGSPLSSLSSPIAVPAGAHSIIDVSHPIKLADRERCQHSKPPPTAMGEYDSEGIYCKEQQFNDQAFRPILGCAFAFHTFMPNHTDGCSIAALLTTKMAFAHGFDPSIVPQFEKWTQERERNIESDRTRCQPLCNRWKYTPRPSFSELYNSEFTSPVGHNITSNITISRVTIFLDPPFYLSKRELDLAPFYKTFLLMSDLFALYVGGSVVAIFELGLYAGNLGMVYWKTRKQINKVGPQWNASNLPTQGRHRVPTWTRTRP